MAKFGTIEVYEEMAGRLNSDADWARVGGDINCTMVFDYSEPISRRFFMRFADGKVPEVRELDVANVESPDFALSSDPKTWRAVLERKTSPTKALMKGKIKVEGNMTSLMKNMKAFNHLLDVMSEVPLS